MKFRFWKMHGAGNDFILLDDRAGLFPDRDSGLVRALCDRHDGVGGEGLILIRPSECASFRMLFFNPDGGAAAMCGNGARCAARLARQLGIAPMNMTVETSAGILRAEMASDDLVRLELPNPTDFRVNRALTLDGQLVHYSFVNTGVPHVVLVVPDVAGAPVNDMGRALRYHPDFAPAGANVDFMTVTDRSSIAVRTYERGVENETPACGTGITACALAAGKLGLASPPVAVRCAHGDTLQVDFRLTAAGAERVTLLGPATPVFTGEWPA